MTMLGEREASAEVLERNMIFRRDWEELPQVRV